MRSFLKLSGWLALLAMLSLEAGAIGYFAGQNSVEAVKIPVFVDVPVEAPEKFEKQLRLAVYLDGHIEKLEDGKEPSSEGLEFVVTLDYTPVPGLGAENLEVLMLFSDGETHAFMLTVPGGKLRYSLERKGPKPVAQPSGEGF